MTSGAGEVVVAVRGEIDLSTREPFGRAVRQATTAGAGRVVIDMAEITFMDSSGLAVLAEAHRALGEAPGAIVLRRVRPAVRSVLTLSGLDGLLSIQGPDGSESRPGTGPGGGA
ncbi:MAG TPA: STAS domain-containing protein [Acidimicrobiales bacterium]